MSIQGQTEKVETSTAEESHGDLMERAETVLNGN